MKKPKKLTNKLPKPSLRRRKGAEERVKEAFANVPKITNETVAEHREDVLRGARKFIYPLKHSRRRVVTISASIFIAAIVIFITYISVSLYRLQSTSTFTYGVTKVLPFPVAKAGESWVSYNSYLFQLRRYMHYYTTQQEANFEGKDRAQLDNYKKQALDQVVNDAYVKQLAKTSDVKVSGSTIDEQVRLVRSQNRLGTSDREFREVLNEFWGWDEADFRRSLQQELLAQAVVAKLDSATTERANTVKQQLDAGADFATLATQQSDDLPSKTNGGQYAGMIDPRDTDIAPQAVAALIKLQAGQVSPVINTGYSLEIIKVTSVQDGKYQAAHISFNYKPIGDYIKPLKDANPPKNYITF